MDEKMQESIKMQAKKILDDFGKTLESVKFKEKEFKKVGGGFREEDKVPAKYGKEFHDRMFENAKENDGEHIIAEKKEW